ncbi:MAG: hypothetical protein JXE07_00925 [Candidatus Aminicenantes bacterium]|nr:hypothetical protein [Candidatus Aminicenantes bacterium]
MRKLSISVLSAFFFVVMPIMSVGSPPAPENGHLAVLRQIHAEVKEMGFYPGQDFVQQAFFVGEDDDDTNKDIHVSILIRAQEEKDKMIIRVTSMKKDRRNPQARLAGKTKELICLIGGEGVEIRSSDDPEEEIARLAPDILTAVRNKKRLLKLMTEYRVPFF